MLLLLFACSAENRAPGERGEDSAAPDTADPTDSGPTVDTALPLLDGAPLACDAPVASVTYTDVAGAWGLVDTTSDDPARKEHPPVAFADLDGDGDDDVLLAHRDTGLWLHVNDGAGLTSTLVDPTAELTTLALTDLDGDRDLDLFGGGKLGRVRLWRNDAGAFTDVTAAYGLTDLPSDVRDGAFGDYDGDGDPDLFVTTANNADITTPERLHRLYRLDGAAFTDVSDQLDATSRAGLGWQGVWHDFDRDGDLDLYIANAEQSRFGPSRYLRNDGPAGDKWAFTDLTERCGCAYAGGSNMGATPADLDGDGWTDLFVTNTGPSPLLRNDGTGAFYDVAVSLGATAIPDSNWMTFGSDAADADNDGDLDLFTSTGPLHGGVAGPQVEDQPDVFLRWDGAAYTDVAPALGLADPGAGRGVVFGNLDGDGFPDLLVTNQGTASRLWRATCTDAGAVIVELDGPAPNRFGVGARVTLTTEAGVQTRVIDTKPGWAAAAHPRAWFGLGAASGGALTVEWPDGAVTEARVGRNTKVVVVRE